MELQRKWAMPNSQTFLIQPVKDLIVSLIKPGMTVLDPFANAHSIKSHLNAKYICNDLDPSYKCDFSLDAIDFMKNFEDSSVDVVLYDPPYTPRQVKECYTKLELTVTVSDTQASYWANFKKEISRVLKPGGLCLSFGWNSNGIGLSLGMEMLQVLIVAHGGSKNDTIATVERKVFHQYGLELDNQEIEAR